MAVYVVFRVVVVARGAVGIIPHGSCGDGVVGWWGRLVGCACSCSL